MRICHIITTLEIGGAETLLANCCNLLIKNNEVCVIYLKGPAKIAQLFDPAVQIEKINLDRNVVKNLRFFLKEWKPGIVHTHLGHADWFGLLAARNLSVKLFCTMHNISFKMDWRDSFIFKVYFLLFKLFARRAQIICISKAVQNHVCSVLKVPQLRTRLLYNGIPDLKQNLTKTNARIEIGVKENEFVILFVGRLEKQKAVHVLLHSIPFLKKSVKNLSVIIIGSGSELDNLKSLSTNLNIQNEVQFVGNKFNTGPYFLAADLFVLPSIFEGLGIVILEAFRVGLPVIASDLEGPKELITDGVNGLLFPVEDYNKLSDKIIQLKNDPYLYDKIRKESLLGFQGKYEIKNYVMELELMYDKATFK